MSSYDRHELKIVRRGVSVEKVIASYRHFGSLRKAANVCGVSKDTVKNVILRFKVPKSVAVLPSKASYNPKNHYSTFAKWHQAHADDPTLPHKTGEIAKLAGVKPNVVKCYFYRRRQQARDMLGKLPDLRKLSITLEDIEGKAFNSRELETYHYAIELYAARAALQGIHLSLGEVTVIIPSIDRFVLRVKKLSVSVPSSQG